MKFTTEEQNDIRWMNDPDCAHENVRDTIRKIKRAGKWEEFLNIHIAADGTIDCDSLYDYLRHESCEALEDVGLHETDDEDVENAKFEAWIARR